MAEKTRTERWVTNIAVVTGSMAIIAGTYKGTLVVRDWVSPPKPVVTATPSPPSLEESITAATSPAVAAPVTEASRDAGSGRGIAMAHRTAVPPADEPAPPTSTAQATAGTPFSTRVRLRDGEQSVMLQGRLGVGVSFTSIGSTPLATLRILREGVEQNEALVPPQRQFVVEVGGRRYQVAVVGVDFGTREAVVQVDELERRQGEVTRE